MATEIVYGMNPVLELLRAQKRRCHEVFVSALRNEADAKLVREVAEHAGVTVKSISKEEINKISRVEKNQGIAARCDPYQYADLEDILETALKDERKGFIVILDGITDPQNLGSLVRTASLMGVHGLILPRDNSAQVNPTVVKASAGATEHQAIVQVTNISRTITYLKGKGFWTAAAVGESADSLYLHDFKGYNLAIVLGSEGHGIRRLIRERCDYLLSIPMGGPIKSYNVSVAGALFMGEVARQRWVSPHAKSVPESV
ncbi:MAG: 23S rRNA (guanosine(2251)-2'-O)-methyltransferase RlmB [Pseudomonadota bacterium]